MSIFKRVLAIKTYSFCTLFRVRIKLNSYGSGDERAGTSRCSSGGYVHSSSSAPSMHGRGERREVGAGVYRITRDK